MANDDPTINIRSFIHKLGELFFLLLDNSSPIQLQGEVVFNYLLILFIIINNINNKYIILIVNDNNN